MSAVLLMAIALAALGTAYGTYGRFVAGRFDLDDARETPAFTHRDGVDYEPAPVAVVLGHHFASIAGAGPIVGPIIAVAYGWLPAFLWIVIGSIFIGAAHDFGALVASLRHGGRSIGEIIEEYVGVGGKRLFVVFAFSALILVVAVFTDVVAKTFVATPAVATSSVLFIVVAVAFGSLLRAFPMPLVPATLVGVSALAAAIWVGTEFPIIATHATWVWVVLGYVFVAAVTPVWVLLQPRDYLNSFLLYILMAGAVLGIFVARPTIEMAAFTGFNNATLGPLFPILFVTVACGSISGFHSLVASGTTSKQLSRESDAKLVGYGAMLIEAVLAVVALISAAMLSGADFGARLQGDGPIAIFSSGVGGFMASLGVPAQTGVTFVALTVSAFALTSLDTCTRLARFLFQEFFDRADIPKEQKPVLATNRFIGTAVVVLLGGALTLSGEFSQVWPVFGSANQLLAALALLAVAVWLARSKVRVGFVLAPTAAMFAVTLTALARLFAKNAGDGNWVLATLAALLFVLALVLLVQSAIALRRVPQTADAAGG